MIQPGIKHIRATGQLRHGGMAAQAFRQSGRELIGARLLLAFAMLAQGIGVHLLCAQQADAEQHQRDQHFDQAESLVAVKAVEIRDASAHPIILIKKF